MPLVPLARALAAVCMLLLAAVALSSAQAPPPPPSNPPKWALQMTQSPELMAEFVQLFERLQREVRYPAARNHSRLMPLMPQGTSFYAAMSNYGDAAQQALNIFHQEMQRSPALREWWQKSDTAGNGAKFEDALKKFAEVSQYLGEEIVISGGMERTDPRFVLLAEIRKPGLKAVLEAIVKEASLKSKPGVRILEPKDLALAQDTSPGQDFLVLVRPDYVVAAPDMASLRSFNLQLDARTQDFSSTPFGQRIAQAYADGVTMVSAADLQNIVRLSAANQQQDAATLQRTGFGDLKYMVWEHTTVNGREVSLSELSFNGPRRGIASWLGAPAALGSLDFASPKATMALSFVLSNPAQIYDDLRELASAANPNAFATVTQSEQALNLSLREDLLRLLGGEITFELDSVTPPAPVWKAILKVNDPVHLQRTVDKLLASMHMASQALSEQGVTYHVLSVPSAQAAPPPAYTFVDGYLVIASSQQAASDAVRLHRTGASLAKTKRFQASLPPGHPGGVSALFYEDPIALAALQLQRIAPEMARPLAQLYGKNEPLVMAAYGEESTIRGASTSTAMDAGVIGMAAAIAIPNLLRARTAGNEAAAVATLRVLHTAETTYAATYPDRGFAANLATLGGASNEVNADRAGLVADPPACVSGNGWCEKDGYRFRVSGVCMQEQCPQYVIMATPVSPQTGSRSLCTASDGVIRFRLGPPLTAPVSLRECRTWTPLR